MNRLRCPVNVKCEVFPNSCLETQIEGSMRRLRFSAVRCFTEICISPSIMANTDKTSLVFGNSSNATVQVQANGEPLNHAANSNA